MKMKLIAALLILVAPVYANGIDTNLIAEMSATVTNLVNVPMNEAVATIKAEAQSEWSRAEAEVSNSLADASQRLRNLQANKTPDRRFVMNADQSNIVAQVKVDQDRSRDCLQAIRRRMWARIHALEQLKKSAEQCGPPNHRTPSAPVVGGR